MHALVVNRYPPPTSLYQYAHDLVEANSGRSTLLNIKNESPRWVNPHEGIDIKPSLNRNFFLSGLLSRFTFKEARKFILGVSPSYDFVVHLVAPFASPAFAHGFPTVVTIHDSPLALFKQGLYRKTDESVSTYNNRMRIVRIMYQKAMKLPFLSVNSKHIASAMKEFGYEGEIFVTYPKISSAFQRLDDRMGTRRKLGLPEDKVLILSVSIGEIRKNLEIVKKVMERVKNWASFVRVGTDIGSQYHFSNLDSDTLNSIYNACDLMLVPSLEEGFGYPVAEALKVGLPVVASDIEIFREVAGDCVIYVDPQSVEDISRGLQEALENREILSKKGQKNLHLNNSPEVWTQCILGWLMRSEVDSILTGSQTLDLFLQTHKMSSPRVPWCLYHT